MVLIALAALALVSASVASGMAAQTVRLTARMTAAQVVPKKPKGNVAHATGTFTGTLRSSGSRWNLTWRITYSRLDHPSIVIADIHYGKPRHFGPFVVRLCGPCKSGARGVRRVKASWVPAIRLGNTFITLITGKNPNGEIRGQIRVVR
jgi:hypothetical protein